MYGRGCDDEKTYLGFHENLREWRERKQVSEMDEGRQVVDCEV
jgi:hypothetical protein